MGEQVKASEKIKVTYGVEIAKQGFKYLLEVRWIEAGLDRCILVRGRGRVC